MKHRRMGRLHIIDRKAANRNRKGRREQVVEMERLQIGERPYQPTALTGLSPDSRGRP